MNVLHINDKVTISGGVEVYLSQLHQLLPQAGVGSHWIGITGAGGQQYDVTQYWSTESHHYHDLDGLEKGLRTLIAKWDIELINLHSISDPPLIRRLAQMELPLVRTMHEPRMFCTGQGKYWRFSQSPCNRPHGLHCLFHAYQQGCAPRNPVNLWNAFQNTNFEIKEGNGIYQAIICMSDYMRQEALKVGYADAGLHLNPYFTESVTDSEAPSEPSKRIFFAGRLIEHKGVHMLVDAVIPLLQRYPDLGIDIVGDTQLAYPQLDLAKDNAKQAGVLDNVVFHGWCDRTKTLSLLSQSILVVFPSLYPEAFGIVGIEAMMHGKPVVGFDVGGVGTWLSHEETGLLVSPNRESLSTAIEKLILSPDLRERYGRNAKQIAMEKYLPEIHIGKLKQIYESVI